MEKDTRAADKPQAMGTPAPAPTPAPAQSVVVESATRSPGDWATVAFPPKPSGAQHADFWKHAAAEAMHGWRQHEHHTGKAIQLSREAYDAAIAAACAEDGSHKPHAAAMSPHLGKVC